MLSSKDNTQHSDNGAPGRHSVVFCFLTLDDLSRRGSAPDGVAISPPGASAGYFAVIGSSVFAYSYEIGQGFWQETSHRVGQSGRRLAGLLRRPQGAGAGRPGLSAGRMDVTCPHKEVGGRGEGAPVILRPESPLVTVVEDASTAHGSKQRRVNIAKAAVSTDLEDCNGFGNSGACANQRLAQCGDERGSVFHAGSKQFRQLVKTTRNRKWDATVAQYTTKCRLDSLPGGTALAMLMSLIGRLADGLRAPKASISFTGLFGGALLFPLVITHLSRP